MIPDTFEVCKVDLFTDKKELDEKYPNVTVERVLRIRDLYQWMLANPDKRPREFVDFEKARYGVSNTLAYSDLKIVQSLMPLISKASRDFHRWRYNEMIMETYATAKLRKDTKTMERAASSYAKYNKIDLQDEVEIPYDKIVVQPFIATEDPRVLGIEPIPNVQEKIKKLLDKYRAESIDIEDVDFEDADLEEEELFGDELPV